MEISEQHFAENPEVLEDFVLGRLDRETLARCEGHLRACEACRQAVHVERIIAAGIKRAGRERLKERLEMLTGMPPRRQIPWPHVLSAAAILLILMGVGIYQGWFVTRITPKDALTGEAPQPEGSVESKAPLAANEQGQKPQVTARSSESDVSQFDAERSHQRTESKVKGQDEKPGSVQAPMDRLEEQPATSMKDTRRVDMAQPALVAAGGQQEFWANGTLITETLSKQEADEGRAAKTMMSDAVHPVGAPPAKTDSYGHIIIDQRPASHLPASQQTQQLYNRQTIQTLVRQSESQTQLTLYPESPFDSTQLRYARVQEVAPDSLVVQIGNQRIGYKFPSERLRQEQTETSKAKRR